MELTLVTTQNMGMFDIFVVDGNMYQITGHVGWAGAENAYYVESIDWDNNAELVDLDIDNIVCFDQE